ncbi:Protein turtle-like A, partial [Ophiophagus hannah]
IDRLRAEDQGWYECRVLFLNRPNNHDEFQNGTWIHLIVNYSPVFQNTPPALVEIQDQKSVTLSCSATGNPPPLVSWKRDSQTIDNGNEMQVKNGTLFISRVERTSAGLYSCHATNQEGTLIHTTRLLIQGTSPHAVVNVSVWPLRQAVNVTWEPGFDGGYFQRFSIWYTPISNETTRGVLLLWEPPLHDPTALMGYSLELRQNRGKWEVLSGSIPSSETQFLVPGLIKDTFYEFRLMAFAGSYISYPSNVVNVSTTDVTPTCAGRRDWGRLFPEHGGHLQHHGRLCHEPEESSPSPQTQARSTHCVFLHQEASLYASLRRTLLWGEKAGRNLSLDLSGGHAMNSTNYVLYESHVEQPLPLERISRGPDGRFVVQSEEASREHQSPFSRLEDGESPPESYLQVFSSPEEAGWHHSVHLRAKNASRAQQEAKASGHRQGCYFDYSSSILAEESEPLRIVNISPVAATPYGAVPDTQWLRDTAPTSAQWPPRRTALSQIPSGSGTPRHRLLRRPRLAVRPKRHLRPRESRPARVIQLRVGSSST